MGTAAEKAAAKAAEEAAAKLAQENAKPPAPAAAAKKVDPVQPERFVPAAQSRFATSADFSFPRVSYIPEAGTPLGHLKRPEYWANIKALKVGCLVWVMAEDDSYFAELLVRKVGQGYAKMQVLREGLLEAPVVDLPENEAYAIEFRGAIVKHRVVRKSDGHVLKQGLDSHEDATAWLRDHKRMLAA